MGNRAWHQFTVRRLLVLMTALAALYGAIWSVPLPDAFPQLILLRLIVAGVCTLVVFVGIARWPSLYHELKDIWLRRHQLAVKRQALADEVARLRQ